MLEKKKSKALQESLENEAVEKGKLVDNIRKLNGQLSAVKDRQKIVEILEENNVLKRRMDGLVEEHAEQMGVLKKNVEHMFQENLVLKEENRTLKAMHPGVQSPVEDGKNTEFDDEVKPQGNPSIKSRGFSSQEIDELQTKILLLSSETEELRSANEELEEKLKKIQDQKNQVDVDSHRMLGKLAQLQLELQTVPLNVFDTRLNFLWFRCWINSILSRRSVLI